MNHRDESSALSRTDFGPLLTVDAAAEALAVSRKQVYILISAGDLPATRVGQRIRIRQDELRAYLDANRL